jgi:hypothetical protein
MNSYQTTYIKEDSTLEYKYDFFPSPIFRLYFILITGKKIAIINSDRTQSNYAKLGQTLLYFHFMRMK